MLKKRVSKKGNILTENLIFIILNVVFLVILLLFLFSKTSSEAVLEEKYAKEIALIIDNARPGMTIHLNMEDAIKKAQSNEIALRDAVKTKNNEVIVTLREGQGYSYSFFNDVDVNINPDLEKGEYFIVINEK